MRKTLITAGFVAVLFASGFGVAWATIPDSDGVIHGCRHNTTGSLRVIDSDTGQTCAGNETALNWNQSGPAGPAGPPGLSVYQVVTSTLPSGFIQPGGATEGYAVCPSGTRVLGGGYTDSGRFQVRADDRRLTAGDQDAWFVYLYNDTAEPLSVFTRVTAICAAVQQ